MKNFLYLIIALVSLLASSQSEATDFSTADIIALNGDASEGDLYHDYELDIYYLGATNGSLIQIAALNPLLANRSDLLSPEYPNAIFQDPGGANIGCINTINRGSASEFRNFYVWDTLEPTSQSYEVVLRYFVPVNFKALQAEWLTIYHDVPTGAAIDLTIVKSDGSSVLPTTSLTAVTTNLNSTPSIAAGDVLVMTFKLTSVDGASAAISDIKFNYTN